MGRLIDAVGRTMAVALLVLLAPALAAGETFEARAVPQWYPWAEWSVEEVTHEGNPFDVIAWAVFEHEATGETVRTGLFFAGDGRWKFRFTGTRQGRWRFVTTCETTAALDGLSGVVDVEANDDPVTGRGFVTTEGRHWIWSGSGKAFVPQYAMAADPKFYHDHPGRYEQDLEEWYEGHGFNGIHTAVLTRWFDLDIPSRDGGIADNPDPDLRTFELLETLITRSYEAGGVVHLWMWGDEDRAMTPAGLLGGINGEPDERLQRYIAARLGPLPGWTLGYGFDLWEWVDEEALTVWHAHMRQQMGWPHVLGGRQHGHGGDGGQNLWQMTDRLDYAGFETWRPDYDKYVEAITFTPDKPAFMEDRYRVRAPSPWPQKDYTPAMVRRGLWRAMMAGGVAGIWGYQPGESGATQRFPNREQIRTYATFTDRYFRRAMVIDNARTNGVCLRAEDGAVLVFYFEDEQVLRADAAAVEERDLHPLEWEPVGSARGGEPLRIDLTGLEGDFRAVAVNTLAPYAEIELGEVSGVVEWEPPERGEWAIAVMRE